MELVILDVADEADAIPDDGERLGKPRIYTSSIQRMPTMAVAMPDGLAITHCNIHSPQLHIISMISPESCLPGRPVSGIDAEGGSTHGYLEMAPVDRDRDRPHAGENRGQITLPVYLASPGVG